MFDFYSFGDFPVLFLLLTSSAICGSQKRYFMWYISFLIYWGLICGLIYSLSKKMSYVHLRRVCVHCCWVKCFVYVRSGWLTMLSLVVPSLNISFLVFLSIIVNGIEVLNSCRLFLLNSVCICFIHLYGSVTRYVSTYNFCILMYWTI